MSLRAPLYNRGAGTAQRAGRLHGARDGWPSGWRESRSRLNFSPEVTYELRVSFAEAQYQANADVTIAGNIGNAVASGGGAAAVNVVIVPSVGNAVAAGKVAAVNESLVASVGNAIASGQPFAINQALAAAIGNAIAAGQLVAINQLLAASVGNAVAAGSTATVSTYGARVTWAEAKYEASPNVTVPLNIGNAVAAGSAASVSVYGAVRVTWAEAKYEASPGGGGGDTVSCGIGNAVATGPVGATVSEDITVGCTVGNAVAAGLTASVTATTLISCGTGNAVAAGQQCQVLPPLTAAPSATPGIEPRHRYRVRVGRRWIEVDPLDPVSVKRAYSVAQEDAQVAASQSDDEPQAVAATAVAVQPIQGPDYAGLAKEARRISNEIQAVYAQAMQTALIARLMRERIEQDDEDDIAVLLASI